MNHSKNNNTLKTRKNKYLNEKERYKIEGLKKAGLSNKEIAEQISPIYTSSNWVNVICK